MKKKIEIKITHRELISCDHTLHTAYIILLNKKMKKEGIKVSPSTHIYLESWLQHQERNTNYYLKKRLCGLMEEIFIFEQRENDE